MNDNPDPLTPVGSATVALPVFDVETMLDRLMGDEILAGLIIQAFLEDMPQQLLALQAFVTAGDADGATCQAHRIRGAVSNVGGDAMSALALEMETAGKNGDMEGLRSRTPQLVAQFGLLSSAIAQHLEC